MIHMIDVIEEFNERVEDCLAKMKHATPDQLGLDRRCCSQLWVGEDCIMVRKHDDKTLMYYGGFEYVDPDAKTIIGDYVIYLDVDERVRGHLETYLDLEQEE